MILEYIKYSQIASLVSWAYEVDRKDSYFQVVEMGEREMVKRLVGGVVSALGEITSLKDAGLVTLAGLLDDGDEITPGSILNFLLTDQRLSENGGIAVFALHRNSFRGQAGAEMVGKVLETNYQVVNPKRMPVILLDTQIRR